MSNRESSYGLRGLVGRIIGITARQAKTIEEQRFAESQQVCTLVQQQLQEAVQMDTAIVQRLEQTGYPAKNLDVEREISRIAETVKAWIVHGKFSHNIEIRGRTLYNPLAHDSSMQHPGPGKDVGSYGDVDKIGYYHHSSAVLSMLKNINRLMVPDTAWRNTPSFNRLKEGKNFLSYANADSEDMLVCYNLPSWFRDSSQRPIGRTLVFFLLPQEDAYKFLLLIRQNPDTAEIFLQVAASGIDGDPLRNKPGIARIQSRETILVNLARFNLSNFNPCIDANTGKAFTNLRQKLGSVIGALTTEVVFERSDENSWNYKAVVKEMEENSNGQIEILKQSKG